VLPSTDVCRDLRDVIRVSKVVCRVLLLSPMALMLVGDDSAAGDATSSGSARHEMNWIA
jgi:hypothetical protein